MIIEAESELSLKHGSSKDEANKESNKQVIISKKQMDKCKRFALIFIMFVVYMPIIWYDKLYVRPIH